MKYSVIIPHFNSFLLLGNLISSIPSRDDVEILVVDDCTPGFSEFATNYKDSSSRLNLFFFSTPTNKGAGAARNIGLESARGNWLLFADSDDIFLNGAFETIDSILHEANSDVDIIYFDPKSHFVSNDLVSSRHKRISNLVKNHLLYSTHKSELLLKYTQYVPWSKVIRSKLVFDNNIRFDETKIANDGMFSAKTARNCRNILASLSNIYSVSENEGSITKKRNPEFLYIRIKVFCDFYHFLTYEERKEINISALPLLIHSIRYGLFPAFKACRVLLNNNVSFTKHLNLTSILYKLKSGNSL